MGRRETLRSDLPCDEAMSDDANIDRELWSAKASGWDRQVGKHGDRNRRLAIHPVLFPMLGDVSGQRVLDAGCGTGYLSIRLAQQGAEVTGVDYADGMVEAARRNVEQAGLSVDVQQDDCCRLTTVESASQDLLVSNYVLQDLADHRAALRAFRRVLTDQGRAVLVFGHPFFGVPGGPERDEDGTVTTRMPGPYFDEARWEEVWRGTDSATGDRFDFPDHFTFYHRPLSSYWKAMREAGFRVVDFDEPSVREPYPTEMSAADRLRSRQVAWSVIFHLQVQR